MSGFDYSPAELSGPFLRCILGVASFDWDYVGIQYQAAASTPEHSASGSSYERPWASRSAGRPATANDLAGRSRSDP